MAGGKPKNRLVDVALILVLVAVGYLGYKFVPTYMEHYKVKDAVNNALIAAHRSTSNLEMQRRVQQLLLDYEIEVPQDEITVTMVDQVMTVRFEYDRFIPIPVSSDDITLHFEVEKSRDFHVY